jgi:hypothetical protein
MRIVIFWDGTPSKLIIHRSFGGIYYHLSAGLKVSQAKGQQKPTQSMTAGSKKATISG